MIEQKKPREDETYPQDLPTPAPLTFVSSIMPEGEDSSASSILAQSVQRAQKGPRGASFRLKADNGEDSEDPDASEGSSESVGGLVVSNEVLEVLGEPGRTHRLVP
jgi:hypothetical protein